MEIDSNQRRSQSGQEHLASINFLLSELLDTQRLSNHPLLVSTMESLRDDINRQDTANIYIQASRLQSHLEQLRQENDKDKLLLDVHYKINAIVSLTKVYLLQFPIFREQFDISRSRSLVDITPFSIDETEQSYDAFEWADDDDDDEGDVNVILKKLLTVTHISLRF